jgi:hypothetical protein
VWAGVRKPLPGACDSAARPAVTQINGANHTSLLTPPLEISAVEGLEDVNIQPFTRIVDMRRIVKRHSDELQNGDSGSILSLHALE